LVAYVEFTGMVAARRGDFAAKLLKWNGAKIVIIGLVNPPRPNRLS
jgi:hypothetical protein